MSAVAFEMLVSSFKSIFQMVFMDALEFVDNVYHSISVQLRWPKNFPFGFWITFAFVLIFSDTTHTYTHSVWENLLNFTLAQISIHSKTLKIYLLQNHLNNVRTTLESHYHRPSARANFPKKHQLNVENLIKLFFGFITFEHFNLQ